MAAIPDTLVLKRHRDLAGRAWEIWVRRGLFALVCVLPVLALANLFGQHPGTTTARAAAASVELYAPPRVRSGLLYEARFTVRAHEDLKAATLVLAPGWAEGQQINTIEPSPVEEASRDGQLQFSLGHIAAGSHFTLFMEFQVNPTNVGRHDQSLRLYDGSKLVVSLDRVLTVFP